MSTYFVRQFWVLLCILLLDSCKKEEDFSIEIEKTVFNRESGVLVNALHSGKVKSYEWKILELDSVVSTERSFSLVIPKAGNYTLQLIIKFGINKKITKSVAVKVLPLPGIIGLEWGDTNGSRYDLYIKVTGIQSDGTAYSDSVFYSSKAGSLFPNNSSCPKTVQMQIPPGQYTYWWDFKGQSFFPYEGVKTGQVTIDGDCVKL
jgi:hypothetical protein